MANVDLVFFAGAAAAMGTKEMSVEADTIAQALETAAAAGNEQATTVLSRCSVLLNSVSCADLNTPLKAADRVDVLPPFAGG